VDSTGTITSTGASTQFRAKRTGQNADFRILQGVNNTVLDNNNGDELNLAIAGTYRATLSSTGLAVTGALSATGALSITATAASSISRTLSVGALIASGNLSGLGFVPNSTGLSAGYNYSGGDAETNMIFGASSSSQQMRFQRWDGTTLTNVLSLVGTGNVGIGTASPGAKLDISGNIRLSNSNPNIEFNNGGGMIYGPAANTLAFATGGGPSSPVERARIDSSGNLLVGTTSADPSGAGSSARVVVSTANGGQAALTAYNAGTGAVNIISIENGNGQVGRIQCSGSATSYLTSSDSRLKENVKPITDNSDIIDRLAPKKFDWKTGGKNAYGFIAQEAIEVFPEAVSAGDSEDEIKTPWAMDYSKLVPILVAELQSVRQRLAALEA
jgi:hypothetical protein